MFTIILKYLNLNIPEGSEFLVNYSFNVFILLLVLLFSIINIFGYLISIIILNEYGIERIKYTWLKKYILIYKKTAIF